MTRVQIPSTAVGGQCARHAWTSRGTTLRQLGGRYRRYQPQVPRFNGCAGFSLRWQNLYQPGRQLIVSKVEDDIYRLLRDAIVHGELAPSTPLRLEPLAESFGVSTMPVRVALKRLQQEGLVEQRPYRIGVVAPLDRKDIGEVQAIRIGLEGVGARMGAPRLSDADITTIEGLLADGRRWAATRDLNQYVRFLSDIHNIVYVAAHNTQLLQLIKDYEARAERYIRVAVGFRFGFEESIQHQDEWLAACRERDGEQAERVIRRAIGWTVDHLEEQMWR